MPATVEVIDGRTVMYISDPYVRRLLEEVLVLLKADVIHAASQLSAAHETMDAVDTITGQGG